MAKGDTNSKFYHARLQWRLLNNKIKGLSINGEWCKELVLIKEEVYQFFASRFTTQSKYRANLDGLQFSCINEVDNEMLCNLFSEDEILGVVREC